MDETAVWLDCPGDTTVAPIGGRTVKVKTTNTRIFVSQLYLLQRQVGKNKSQLIVLKGKRLERELVTSNLPCLIRMSLNGWVNQYITSQFLQLITTPFYKRMLIWDAFLCHTSDATKEKWFQEDVPASYRHRMSPGMHRSRPHTGNYTRNGWQMVKWHTPQEET